MPRLSVQQLFDERRERLGLAWAAGTAGAGREFTGEMLHKPGVGLIGHLNLIHPLLAQVLGPREIEYVARLEGDALAQTVERIVGGDTLCVIVGDAVAAPPVLIAAADRAKTALLTSTEPSQHLINVLRPYMQQELGEVTTLHGVCMDVLGLGVLITGDSGVGKSELGLELISRGHGLVADDVVEISRMPPRTLECRCPPMLKDFLEVRGLGVLNIRTIFGETAVRPKMNLRLVVHLERPTRAQGVPVERLPLHELSEDILGVTVRKVVIPVAAGRNLAVLLEAAVRNHILHLRGINST